MNDTKYYAGNQITDKFDCLTPQQKIHILWESLDYMQAYNGRSKTLCIAMALGYDNDEGEDNTYYKRRPV